MSVKSVLFAVLVCASLCSVAGDGATVVGEWPNSQFKYFGFWNYLSDTSYRDFEGSANLCYVKNIGNIADANSRGFNVLLNVQPLLIAGSQLVPNVDTVWKNTAVQVAPFVTNGTLFGFFVGDELMWGGLPYSLLNYTINMIRTSFPKSIIYYNEAYPVFERGFG
jgi:hypothetical protein